MSRGIKSQARLMLVILPSPSALHSCAYLLLSLSIPLIRGLPFSLHCQNSGSSHCPISIISFNIPSIYSSPLDSQTFESFDGPLAVLITSKNYHDTRLSINLGTSVLILAPN
ncbi:hypothetical protein GE21DRAFT_1291721 [Neurospora crassa]|nr:hypothetical protein GE21DRAFT_1291721 [Neurospora crassa]